MRRREQNLAHGAAVKIHGVPHQHRQDGVLKRAGEEAQEVKGVFCVDMKTRVPPSEPTKKKKKKKPEVDTEKSETGESLGLTS